MRRPFMFPPVQQPIPPMWRQPMIPPAPGGMFSRLFGTSFPWQMVGGGGALPSIDTMLTNVQKMLNVVQTVTPMVQQYGPLIKSFPSMMKLFRELKQTDSANAATEQPKQQKENARPVPVKQERKKEKVNKQGVSTPKLYI